MTNQTLITKFRKFSDRHIGPNQIDTVSMLKILGYQSRDELIQKTIPPGIRLKQPLDLPSPATEAEALSELKITASQNKIWRSYIGMGYHGTIVPPVIQRNILENPGWYTQYTPYQPEISQGRLEALLNFQTMIAELTGFPFSNGSLLDEATAAAEAMMMSFSGRTEPMALHYFVSHLTHPQVIELIKTRAEPFGIHVEVGDVTTFKPSSKFFGLFLQYPGTNGEIISAPTVITAAKQLKLIVTCACDVLSLLLLESPGALGADIAVGSTQRFGVPMGFGGPHAAYIATTDEHKRRLPGRIVGVSKDRDGKNAIRLALQTREQHIRREKATSNICTSQVLLAIMSSMYACYHGPEGLTQIALRVRQATATLAAGLKKKGFEIKNKNFFDTLSVKINDAQRDIILKHANDLAINLRIDEPHVIGITLDETVTEYDLKDLLSIFGISDNLAALMNLAEAEVKSNIPPAMRRSKPTLSHSVFSRFRSETELMRYIRGLESKDLSLTSSMIPLGSCTMKLNAAAELFPVSWPEFSSLHPFAPKEQTLGYHEMFGQLETWLAEITGFYAVSLQPNSGSQGEYAGLMTIRAYLRAKGESKRQICLIPQSAHGTNPASAAMAGLKIIVVACDSNGNIDMADLQKKAKESADELACLMVTYPSTHGVFEEGIHEICATIHQYGGQVYMDGANMNAQVGLCRPGDFGPDVCHLNLHKTFCIPHGGGGPGMGPIGVAKHLAPFLPGHSVVGLGEATATTAVAAAPWGSASILPISWMYIRMMGAEGLKLATETAILNANYVAKRLDPYFPVLYKGKNGMVAHECILDVRPTKAATGIDVDDIAKRLMDYGFHAPTVSFPVAGTLMIEPTESEGLEELDRFCDAMISIKKEIDQVASGFWDRQHNPLKMAPHTAAFVTTNQWDLPYSREVAVFPAPWTKERKFWPSVSRIDAAYGDRNLVCTCPDIQNYS